MAANEKPNIIVIMVDDVAPFDISAIHRGLGAERARGRLVGDLRGRRPNVICWQWTARY